MNDFFERQICFHSEDPFFIFVYDALPFMKRAGATCSCPVNASRIKVVKRKAQEKLIRISRIIFNVDQLIWLLHFWVCPRLSELE